MCTNVDSVLRCVDMIGEHYRTFLFCEAVVMGLCHNMLCRAEGHSEGEIDTHCACATNGCWGRGSVACGS